MTASLSPSLITKKISTNDKNNLLQLKRLQWYLFRLHWSHSRKDQNFFRLFVMQKVKFIRLKWLKRNEPPQEKWLHLNMAMKKRFANQQTISDTDRLSSNENTDHFELWSKSQVQQKKRCWSFDVIDKTKLQIVIIFNIRNCCCTAAGTHPNKTMVIRCFVITSRYVSFSFEVWLLLMKIKIYARWSV